MAEVIAERYRRFAANEARGRSPLYERLAIHVANNRDALRFLAELPPDRQQPNLLFAALRLNAGTPRTTDDFDHALATHADGIADTMLSRTTQTNEPGRCACLLLALARIEGPLALIEVGAAAGLCLLPDQYGYDWRQQKLAPPADKASAPVFPCSASANTPLPLSHPKIVWRAGLDLNPLDLAENDTVTWLEHLVWPEHQGRLERLRAAIRIAWQAPPRVEQGDLRTDLPALIAEAPPDATLVVFHTAVLSYVAAPEDRDAFASSMIAADAIWISNEAPHIFAQFAPPLDSRKRGEFLLAADGQPLAWTEPHGQAISWD